MNPRKYLEPDPPTPLRYSAVPRPLVVSGPGHGCLGARGRSDAAEGAVRAVPGRGPGDAGDEPAGEEVDGGGDASSKHMRLLAVTHRAQEERTIAFREKSGKRAAAFFCGLWGGRRWSSTRLPGSCGLFELGYLPFPGMHANGKVVSRMLKRWSVGVALA